MRIVNAGGAAVSAVGLGTWQFGSREWGYGAAYAGGEAARIVERALDLGVTLFDTAEIYGRGRSETILGRALAGRRDEVFLATKYAPFFPHPAAVRRHAQASLRRLGTDSVDLYQVHWPNPLAPSGPMFGALADLKRAGLVAHVGVSNHSPAGWRSAEAAFGGPILSNQVEYNLVTRGPEAELLPWAQANDRLIIAYSPLAQGAFSGRWSATSRPGGVRSFKPLFTPENMRRAEDLRATLSSVAAGYGATPSQVALAWLLRRPNVVVIPGASSVAQLEGNVAAADLDLTAEDDDRLVRAAARFEPRTGVAAAADVVRAKLGR
ncbi:aldo/keto reductase [Acidiferrimicrobium sp. IK]|uniref:aldo/keto reductase n=1 Tax=Acidiferrimicrobium sp. IK TaxID=2871700 RepID=UPI0021CB258F|nr:aldo/keto reductase [Acidiferrimicrobium sp. IK]MCU4184274.1 aldo/keto reductase [Acidiferrimicrobium sp. IK]